MKLRDYLLTKLMEESADIIKISGELKRYGCKFRLPNSKDMTLEEKLHSELVDAITATVLLNLSGMDVAPGLVGDLLREESMYIDVSYRINYILKNLKIRLKDLQIEKEDFERLEEKAKRFLKEASDKFKELEKIKIQNI